LAIALFSTVLPIWLAARAVERLGAGKTAAMGTIGPVLTIFFGWVILSEPFSWLQVLGLALVVTGVSWVGKTK
jgi:drug/metabolite transporter (DMT)-like permease